MKPRSRDNRPLHIAVRETMREAISRGKYKPGERLPSTLKLAEEMSVSLVTMHRAMQELVATGVLRRGQGRGTYIHEDFAGKSPKTQGLRVGMLSPLDSSLTDWAHAQMVEGVRQRARDLGIDLVLLRSGGDNRGECDGYLQFDPTQEQLARPIRFGKVSQTPNALLRVVLIGGRAGETEHGCVRVLNAEIGKRALTLLLESGHRRLGFVAARDAVSDASALWSGFAETAQSRGTPIPVSACVRQGTWKLEESGIERLAEILRANNRPTAILPGGHEYALGVYEAARRTGLSIPTDLSVIGVDDPPSARHLAPPLTTFRRPLLELGRLAVSELTELIASRGSSPRQVTLPGELVERESVARPGDPGR
ncbi:MAG: GntR family transcriptional regulator [Planctomycetota bacterium]